MADLLDVDLSYLIGYEQKPFQIQSISDVLYFFYQLDRVTELKYDIKVDTESDFDKWNCDISFNRANSEESIFSRFAFIMSMFSSVLYRRSKGWISPYEFNIIVDRFLAENKQYTLHSTPADNTGYQEFAEVYKGIDEAIERERLEQEKSIYPKTMMD